MQIKWLLPLVSSTWAINFKLYLFNVDYKAHGQLCLYCVPYHSDLCFTRQLSPGWGRDDGRLVKHNPGSTGCSCVCANAHCVSRWSVENNWVLKALQAHMPSLHTLGKHRVIMRLYSSLPDTIHGLQTSFPFIPTQLEDICQGQRNLLLSKVLNLNIVIM